MVNGENEARRQLGPVASSRRRASSTSRTRLELALDRQRARLCLPILVILLAGVSTVVLRLQSEADRGRPSLRPAAEAREVRPQSARRIAGNRSERPVQSAADPIPAAGFEYASSTADESPGVELPAVDDPGMGRAPQVFALAVGINDYPGSASDLRGAVADARDMTAALALFGVPNFNVEVLLDDQASAPRISSALQRLEEQTGADDTVVLFFAGHVRKADPQGESFVAADGNALPDWYLAQQLEGLRSRKVWIVMATCYGGGFTELLAPGRVLTAAADENSLAYENDSLGRSYLDEYLINQALLQQRAAGPSAQQAFEYAQQGLQRDYPDRTLTQIDQSTGPISLQSAASTDPPAEAPSGPSPNDGGTPDPAPPSSPPTTPPADPSCRNPLRLLCPAGSS